MGTELLLVVVHVGLRDLGLGGGEEQEYCGTMWKRARGLLGHQGRTLEAEELLMTMASPEQMQLPCLLQWSSYSLGF